MPTQAIQFSARCLLLLLALTLAACIEDSGSSDDGAAPSSLIGKTMVQTITANDGRSTTISVGDTITYQFIDSTTILGAGDNVVPTTSWSYQRTGSNTARVELVYHGGISWSTDELTFSTASRGTFDTEANAGGTPGAYSGTFVISEQSGAGGGDGGGGGSDNTPPCETNNTGTVTFWVSTSDVMGTVTVDVNGLGSRSSSYHYPGSGPVCGDTGTGPMTFTDVTATSYSYTAADESNISWGPASVTVPQCECVRVELR